MATPSSTNHPSDRGRFSAQRKTDAVLRLLRGEDLDALSRELGVTAATLSTWREDFLAGGKAALRSRPADGRAEQLHRLQAEVGELTMDNGLLRLRCGAGVPGLPFVLRRPRPWAAGSPPVRAGATAGLPRAGQAPLDVLPPPPAGCGPRRAAADAEEAWADRAVR